MGLFIQNLRHTFKLILHFIYNVHVFKYFVCQLKLVLKLPMILINLKVRTKLF